ncbi:hypothetical protein [Nocardia sp. NPDC051570]|uniref:hypothetical protein n=1 Tax=Nocardia sp. NPDC051570 TaxID=3364324 RepID=UPI0037B4078B
MPNRSSRAGILAVLVVVCAGALAPAAGPASADPAACAAGDPLRPQAELFATDNTAVITDPGDPRLQDRLQPFEFQVDAMVVTGMALPVGSDLLDGVFWSDTQQAVTYERSREFRLACVSTPDLRAIAERVRARFAQESVLIFQPLAADDPAADAVQVEVPGLDSRRLHDVLLADADAREQLSGGSVTEAGVGLLITERADLETVRRTVEKSGASWSSAAVRYGTRDFVEATGH